MAKATQRLWLDAERSTVVPEGDPSAAFLLAAEGDEIPDGFEEPKAKQSRKPANKQADAPANKSAKSDD